MVGACEAAEYGGGGPEGYGLGAVAAVVRCAGNGASVCLL